MYAVTIENRGDTRFHATSRGYGFVLGPQGAGANPGDTLLAGLCACVGHYVREFLSERKLASSGFGLTAEAEPTPDQSRLARIEVRIDLGGTSLDAAGQRDLLAVTERCKLRNTLSLACPVTVSLAGQPARNDVPAAPGCCA